MDLYIVFGSETKLLKKLFSRRDTFFIRIFNTTHPSPQNNCVDVNSFDLFEEKFIKLQKKILPKKIIFLGAAFITQNKLFFQEREEDIHKSLLVNIHSYTKYVHFLLPHMIKIRSGQFIYLSSFRSSNTCRGVSLYSASKAFGEKFFEVIGKENAAFGVYSASIKMGYFDGRMTNIMGEEKIKQFKLSIGNRSLGSSEDLLKSIEYIIQNKYTNGGTIDLTGGISF